MSKLPASTGWLWLKQGFRLFAKQPGMLMMMLFGSTLATLLLSALLPFVGVVVATVLIPAFTMAIMQACYLVDQGQRVVPNVLLTGFRKGALAPLCRVGAVYLGVSLILRVCTQLALSDKFWQQFKERSNPAVSFVADTSDVTALALIFLLQAMALLLLCYSAPLTHWMKMKPGKATFYSVFGVLGAFRPLLVMLFAWLGIFMAAGMVAALIFGQGSAARVVVTWLTLMFMLILQCGIYVSYRQIFGDPDAVEVAPK